MTKLNKHSLATSTYSALKLFAFGMNYLLLGIMETPQNETYLESASWTEMKIEQSLADLATKNCFIFKYKK